MYSCTCCSLCTATEDAMQVVQWASLKRHKLAQIKTWKFKGFLIDTCDDLPAELMVLLNWIIVGDKSTPTECRYENINRTCNKIA